MERSDEIPDNLELSPTGKVILGMIAAGRCTGYEIKQLVDKTTRHFWAASYGQIYPELRQLEVRGFVHGRPEPSGGRRRTVYQLTDSGRRALDAWLETDGAEIREFRDEGMLKLFFSDALPERRVANIRAMRTQQERKLEQLQALEPHASTGPPGMYLTLKLGLAQTKWTIEWCESAIRELSTAEQED
jgi:PadR family transcriptional regulator, regulatory protein AphA